MSTFQSYPTLTAIKVLSLPITPTIRKETNNVDDQLDATIKKNSVALVRERTIPTERPPQVGEVSANFWG